MLQRGHARESVEITAPPASDARRHPGFNGATLVRAWRYGYLSRRANAVESLQRGHARESVEMHTTTPMLSAWWRLQRGHARESVEIVTEDNLHLASFAALQRGHARESVEMDADRAMENLTVPLQRGHARESVEIPC